MSVTRNQLGPVHGFDNHIQWSDALSKTNYKLVRWVFGTGFLTVHLALFGMSLLAALGWNLITDPADLRIVEPFRYWGIVAIVHTILAGGGVLGWRLFQMGRPQTREFQIPARSRAIAHPHPQSPGQARLVQPVWSAPAPQAERTGSPARRWGTVSLRKAAPWAARDVKQGWPEQPAMIRSMSESDGSVVDVGEVTWPDSAPLSTTLLASSETRSGPEADHVVSVDHRSTANQADASQTWIEGFIESRSGNRDNRWSWVEAAASNWLSKRDTPAVSPGPTVENSDAASTAPDMAADSGQSENPPT